MALILPNSVFLHIPKTGGMTVRKVIDELHLDRRIVRSEKSGQSVEGTIRTWHVIPIWDADFRKRRYKFCFVRDPLEWYRSRWAFRVSRNNWQQNNALDAKCKDHDFQGFIDKVIEHFPSGYVSWLYHTYTQYCQFVGRTENLEEDLFTALKKSREEFDEKLFHEACKYRWNTTPSKFKEMAVYTKSQKKKIKKIEKEAITKYGYN